jgi:hypothetical protein
MENIVDAYLSRLQNIPPFDLQTLDDQGNVIPWYRVDGSVMRDLVVQELNFETHAAVLPMKIFHWGRLAARARRVWEVREREYRTWRDALILKCIDAGDKKPTQKELDAQVRTHPMYGNLYARIEAAEEATNAAEAIVTALKAQKEVLRIVARRYAESGATMLTD